MRIMDDKNSASKVASGNSDSSYGMKKNSAQEGHSTEVHDVGNLSSSEKKNAAQDESHSSDFHGVGNSPSSEIKKNSAQGEKYHSTDVHDVGTSSSPADFHGVGNSPSSEIKNNSAQGEKYHSTDVHDVGTSSSLSDFHGVGNSPSSEIKKNSAQGEKYPSTDVHDVGTSSSPSSGEVKKHSFQVQDAAPVSTEGSRTGSRTEMQGGPQNNELEIVPIPLEGVARGILMNQGWREGRGIGRRHRHKPDVRPYQFRNLRRFPDYGSQ